LECHEEYDEHRGRCACCSGWYPYERLLPEWLGGSRSQCGGLLVHLQAQVRLELR